MPVLRVKRPKELVERMEVCGQRCDLCGLTSRSIYGWQDTAWDCSKVTIEAQIGDVFPETDCRTHYQVTICPTCFLDRVKPAIEALGCRFTEYEHDFDGAQYEDITAEQEAELG